MSTEEKWLPVAGYENAYEVSDMGRVRSLDRWIPNRWGGKNLYKGTIICPELNHNGYFRLGLHRDGYLKMKFVHNLVAESFIGVKPEGYDYCHNDGIRTNNILSNLRYDTKESNQCDRRKHGTENIGIKHGMAKISEDDVREIIRLKGIVTQKELSKRFGIVQSKISAIQRRQLWKHIVFNEAA